MLRLNPQLIRNFLGKLSAHIVVALVALVAIGGATRVMEAGLACPDWPLCYGSLFPRGQMNLQVFLEWFHRLDAFFVGIAISLQFILSLIYKSFLPRWLPLINGIILILISLQGALGALTVIDLLPSTIVMSHLLLALTLVALMSGLTQKLFAPEGTDLPLWWKLLSRTSLLVVIIQSLIGSRMATTWGAQACLATSINCKWLDIHRISAFPILLVVLSFVFTSILSGGWFRDQWPFLTIVFSLLTVQIFLGVFSVNIGLNEPLVRVAHQLIACLLVAFLSALSCRSPNKASFMSSQKLQDNSLEVCHG